MTHYERLGVDRLASADDVRAAYRRAARRLHPDANGQASADAMAEVNLAWRVLGDADRRRAYDNELAEIRGQASSAAGSSVHDAAATRTGGSQVGGPQMDGPHPAGPNPLARYQDPPRFPWRFMSVLAVLGIAVVILGVILQSPSPVRPVDNVLGPGSCVVLQTNGDAAEVDCGSAHDAVVDVLIPIGERCPDGTEGHRDRQGMGTACVTLDG